MEKKISLVPRLRFPEFREVGEWEEKTVEELSENVTAGGTPDTSEARYWNGKIRWMSSGELNHKRVYEVQGRITDSGFKNSSTKLIPEKCVLIGLAGQGKTRGTVAMNMVKLCINQSIAAIFPNQHKCSSDFLYHNLDNRYDELRRLSAGGEGRGGLNLQIIKSLWVPLPELEEQQKIADCLSSLDELITAETQQLDTLKIYKKGLMQQLFPREGEAVPRLRFPEFREAGEWKRLTVADACKINPSRVNQQDHELVSFVPMALVSEDGWIEASEVRAFVDVKKGYTAFVDNDVIIAKITPCFENGKAALAKGLKNGVGFGSTEFHVFRPYESCLPEFLFLQLYRDEVRAAGAISMIGNAGQRRVPISFFESFPFYLPSIDEQQSVVDLLSSLNDLIFVQAQKIEALKIYKKGLMQQLFPVIDEMQE